MCILGNNLITTLIIEQYQGLDKLIWVCRLSQFCQIGFLQELLQPSSSITPSLTAQKKCYHILSSQTFLLNYQSINILWKDTLVWKCIQLESILKSYLISFFTGKKPKPIQALTSPIICRFILCTPLWWHCYSFDIMSTHSINIYLVMKGMYFGAPKTDVAYVFDTLILNL